LVVAAAAAAAVSMVVAAAETLVDMEEVAEGPTAAG
jgi:hypothetical protein